MKLYNIPWELDEMQVRSIMPSLLLELSNYGEYEELEIVTTTDEMEKTSLLDSLTSLFGTRFL